MVSFQGKHCFYLLFQGYAILMLFCNKFVTGNVNLSVSSFTDASTYMVRIFELSFNIKQKIVMHHIDFLL